MKRLELFLLAIQAPLDFFLLVAAAASAYALRFSPYIVEWRPVMFSLSFQDYIRVAVLTASGWMVLFAISGLYSTDQNRRFASDIYKIFLACSAGLAGIALVIMFTQQLFDSRFLAAAGWVFAMVYISLGRLFMRGARGYLHRIGIGMRRVIMIGITPVSQALSSAFERHPSFGYVIVGNYCSFKEAEGSLSQLKKIDELFYTNTAQGSDDAIRAVHWCIGNQVVFKHSADLFATYATNISVQPIAGIPIVEIKRTRLDGWGRIAKRICDIVGGGFLIISASPVMVVSAVAILLDTGGPVFYKNERVGFQGKRFFAWKFRSMHRQDCTGKQFGESGKAAEKREEELIRAQNTKNGPVYKIGNDPRVTRVGRFIRRWSIDELPQFFNVIMGDMSLVGPRPHQPREVEKYETENRKVLFVKPGITGLAQISGRSDLSFDEEARLDAFYMEQWSLFLDAIILLKTPFILFRKRNVL